MFKYFAAAGLFFTYTFFCKYYRASPAIKELQSCEI